MKRPITKIIFLASILIAVITQPAFAVSEGQMSRPSSYGINQGYLYGERLNSTTVHKGNDFLNPYGTAVYASYSGTILDVDSTSAEGYYVKLDHGGSVYTYYCHLKESPKDNYPNLIIGHSVNAGDLIGYSGDSGYTATGSPHLHFSVRVGGHDFSPSYIRNPEKWLNYLSDTGKISGNAWNNRSDPTSGSGVSIRIGSIPKPSGTYGAYTYGRDLWNFGDSEDWFASDVSSGNRTMTTSNLGYTKTLYVPVVSGQVTRAEYDVGNTINDSYEYNESFGSATSISIGSTYNSYIFNSKEKDYFKFTPSSSGSIIIDLTSLPKDYDLALYNSSYSNIGNSMNGGTSNEQITFPVTAGNTYYLQVYGYSGVFDIYDSYSLRVHY